ncbi:Cornichon family protein [Perilla frutescens var. hirtella]|uniref:Cornichon family protein n=1 Tax=Perilla frutescens var. hirtella TaxID=608512 RepID=A0AAD4JPR8_PERFH|nr:Cornichon family protein [Perilla frutescens var. hirtella]
MGKGGERGYGRGVGMAALLLHTHCSPRYDRFPDLEFDYINPYDSASRINKVVLPEFITQGVLCFLFLVTGHWFMSLLCVPYLYYNVRLYLQKQHLVDVTEIFNLLNWEKKQRLFKLGYIILLLFMCLFWMIYNALEDDDEHSF